MSSTAPIRRLRVPAGLVERSHRIPQLRRKAVDRVGEPHPRVAARVVTRLGRRRERRVGERADRDDDQIRLRRLGVEDLRAAVRAEMEDVLLPVRLVGDAEVVVEAAGDLYLIGFEPRLHPEGASGPALAGEAVADRDGEGLARDLETELPTVTGGLARRPSRPKASEGGVRSGIGARLRVRLADGTTRSCRAACLALHGSASASPGSPAGRVAPSPTPSRRRTIWSSSPASRARIPRASRPSRRHSMPSRRTCSSTTRMPPSSRRTSWLRSTAGRRRRRLERMSAEDYAEVDALARANGVGVVAAGNFSLTAALLLRFAAEAARHLPRGR